MNTTKTKTRDPAGGLTAAGRTAFLRKEEAQLKPGVRARMSDMTPDEMKRKGSWAVRFYGRKARFRPSRTQRDGRHASR